MEITYETLDLSLIENTTMKKSYKDGVPSAYYITPISGYKIHDKGRDCIITNENTGEDELILGFTTGTVTCRATYDFILNPSEFYTIEI